MLRSIGLHKFKFALIGLALVFLLGLSVIQGSPDNHPVSSVVETSAMAARSTVPSAPPVTVDSVLPNLFYGAIPAGGDNAPVVVFIHGLSGSYADWLEANNCPDAVTPCGPKGPGVGTGNDMYDFAYAAGFRTAFMSLTPNNTSNSLTIQNNAAVLQQTFPRILANFNVSKVYFVCHSKGGLDLQLAIANPQWIGIANAVIMLGTPNQGDAFADFLFNTAQGQQLLQVFTSLNTPGVQSLQSANVQQFRPQWDAMFENAGIPFYTVAGDVCKEPKPSAACTAVPGSTGPTLLAITGGTHAPPNDWLVTEPETYLPSSYAMALGVEAVNHYQLRLGDNSFSMIYARVMGQENQQTGVTRVATNGFGDEANSEAWSMAWFNGQLYVGTGREVYCVTAADAAILSGLPALYPPAVGDCSPDYHLLPLQGEIWQYTPQTNTWLRVFQSPNSQATTSNTGAPVATARDMGIRSLTVVQEPGGTVALYAGTVTSGAIFEPLHTLGGWPPPRILRSTDGINWTPIPQDPGTFLGNLSTAAESTQSFQNFGVRSGGQLNGVVYFQVGDYSGVGRVIGSLPGSDPSVGNNNFQYVSPAAEALPVWILQVFNGFVYAGTGNPYGAPGPATEYGVWKTNGLGTAPYTWQPIITLGAYATGLVSNYALSFEVFADPTGCPATAGRISGGAGGCLYVGTDQPSELVRIHPDNTGQVQVANDTDDSWDLVVGNPRTIPPGNPGAGQLISPISGIGQYFDNGFTGHFWRMGVGGQGLYMSTYDSSAESSKRDGFAQNWSQEFGTDIFRTPDGIHWTAVTKIGMGDGMNTGGRSFQATPFGLFWGTARPAVGGAQIFNVDNTVLDFNRDHVIDQNDVNLLSAKVNTKAKVNDPMDLNRDGKITAADVQLLKSQCTYPKCAVPAFRAISNTLGVPVVHSAPGQLGASDVSLDWPAITGAVDYLVYRINMSTSTSSPPPGYASTPGGATSFGYPGAPQFVTRVTTGNFTETPPSSLQLLYFVRAEDASGNLSAPSNIVGGPSLAGQ